MPTQTLLAGNSTNNTTAKAQDYPIFKADKDGITSLAILAAILAFFAGIILRDLLNKRRTGEFKEDKKSCGKFFRTLFCLPCLICSKDNVRRLWIKFTNLFRSKDNQRVVKKSDQNGIEMEERLESGKSVGGFNGKAIDTTVLPKVTEFSVDHNKDDEGFTFTPVHGAGTRAARHGSTEHGNTLGVYNHGDLSTEKAGSSSANHHHSAGSSSASAGRHWWSSVHGHGHGNSYSPSHSNSHSHDYGSHSHDYGHTDSGGFDGCDGGGD
ncbi:hypothetical protein FOC1_g10008083 [Fusarium oxysporum f. sp. cubense race 1]|uniref:Uncharacterized protein n=1 Tax=Fusarium oxysporum f. sp. cubense (strain race 1) TaxID=1229664 RepID=N4U1V9_FUSC1|nr:hypothetical protein FOC1_g10008083 [Fusarium oxysporum f. sp. cubense race 1]